MNDIFNIGLTGLTAFQTAMNITSQNIANVQTPNYSRRQVNLQEGLFGTGVNVGSINRIYDASTSANLQNCTSNFSASNNLLTGLNTLEPLLDNDSNNTAKYINDTIASLQQLNTDTSSIQGRTLYLNQLSAMTTQFQSINAQILTQQQTINTQLSSVAQDANSVLVSIAHINDQIANSPATTDISSLLDQREQLVQGLAKYLNFTAANDSNNILSISLNNGLQLVGGNQAVTFEMVPDTSYPTNLDIAIDNGSTSVPLNSFVNGGEVAGLLTFRQSLNLAAQGMGRLSLAVAGSINAQNQLGMDYNGNLGADIFTDINNPVSLTNRVIPNTGNTGTANLTVNVNDLTQLTTSDYQLQFKTATTYTLTRIADNTVVSSGSVGTLPQAISADGITINLNSGAVAAGDQFIISPTRGAINNMNMTISDPKLLALGFPVAGVATTGLGSDGTIEITAMTDTTTSAFSTPKQLNPPLKVVFLSPTSYQIQNANTNAVMEGPITYNPQAGTNVFPTPGGYDPGYRVTISGSTIKTGDVFNIEYNNNGNSDNRNGLAIANLYSQGMLDQGTSNYIQAFNLVSGAVSQQTNAIQTQYDSNQILKEQAQNLFEQVSGVDTQEETVDLMRDQEAYQASAQILQTAKSVFDDVIQMLRS
jgi:flagellar hook-associated protein 1